MDIILHAKLEYTKQLQTLVKKPVYNTFLSIFEEAKLDKKEVLKTFQTKLVSIPNWNQDTIYQKYIEVTGKVPEGFMEKLIQAIIISNVKIFGAVKKNSKAKIEIVLPDSKQFVHKIFIQCARGFYQNPSLFENRSSIISPVQMAKNNSKIIKIINDGVDECIRNCLPFSNILEEYFKEEPEDYNTNDIENLTNDIDNIIENTDNTDEYQNEEEEKAEGSAEDYSSDENSEVSDGENEMKKTHTDLSDEIKEIDLSKNSGSPNDSEDDEFFKE